MGQKHLQPRPQYGLPRRLFRAGGEKTTQSRSQEPAFRRLAPKTAPADPCRTRRVRVRTGAPGRGFWRETATGPPSQRDGRFVALIASIQAEINAKAAALPCRLASIDASRAAS